MDEVGRSLEHLVQVLQTDNSMVEHLRDKYQRSEMEKVIWKSFIYHLCDVMCTPKLDKQ